MTKEDDVLKEIAKQTTQINLDEIEEHKDDDKSKSGGQDGPSKQLL